MEQAVMSRKAHGMQLTGHTRGLVHATGVELWILVVEGEIGGVRTSVPGAYRWTAMSVHTSFPRPRMPTW